VRAAGASIVSVEHPQTTLESLFLDALKKDERGWDIMTEAAAIPSPSANHERVGFSLSRVSVIGVNTLTKRSDRKCLFFYCLSAWCSLARPSFSRNTVLGNKSN